MISLKRKMDNAQEKRGYHSRKLSRYGLGKKRVSIKEKRRLVKKRKRLSVKKRKRISVKKEDISQEKKG